MEAEKHYSELQQKPPRRGMVFAAGILGTIFSIIGILTCIGIIISMDWFINWVVDLVAESEGVPAADVMAVIADFKWAFYLTIAYSALASLICLIPSIKFITKYSKMTNDEEFKQAQTPYIVWTVVLFLTAGLIVGILAAIPLFASSNQNINASAGYSNPAAESNVEKEIAKLKDLKTQGLLTEEEYTKLVVSLINEKK